MSDDYDIGIVAFLNGEVVGNINIQFKFQRKKLPSELFFFQKKWQDIQNINSKDIAELCGLSIYNKLNKKLRETVLGGLILCSHLIGYRYGVSTYVTVQHTTLIKKLLFYYKYPFIKAERIALNEKNIPEDKYWKGSQLPSLYFVDLNDNKTIEASFRILCSLFNGTINIVNESDTENEIKQDDKQIERIP
jgi:hypothetical protein